MVKKQHSQKQRSIYVYRLYLTYTVKLSRLHHTSTIKEGIQMDNQLKWSAHGDYLCAKLAQRLHFRRRVRLFGVSKEVMSTFFDAVH